MIGHEKILEDLKNLCERGALGHGYILHGQSMIGKKLIAREFAEYLESPNEEKKSLDKKNNSQVDHPEKTLSDYMLIETGAASSIGIDAVREIRNFLWQKPNVSLRRTLVIDDAELLTTEAQNALLKITEEPPASSLLILITSDIESILPTIVSRLPKIYVAPVKTEAIAEWLAAEHAGAQALKVKTPKSKRDDFAKRAADIAKRSFGKPGLAFRMLTDENFQEQIELAEKLLKSPATTRRDLIKKIIEPDEFNFRKFLDALLLVVVAQVSQTNAGITAATAAAKNAGLFHKALALYDRETNFSLNPRLQLEALLL